MVKLSYVYRVWVSPGEEQTLSAEGGEGSLTGLEAIRA